MPPKSVTCAICGETVLKAQTLARKDGSRACRSHEGVSEEAQNLKEEEKALRDYSLNHPKKKLRSLGPASDALVDAYRAERKAFQERVSTHCWTCGKEGVGLREYFSQVLVTMKRLELRKEFDLLNLPVDIARLTGNLLPLAVIPFRNETDQGVLSRIQDRRVRDMVPLLSQMLLCGECARRLGFQERWDALFPTPTVEQVKNCAVMVEILDPHLTEMAKKKEEQS